MTRDEVLERIREHLADELEVDPAIIADGTRFKEDLEADSLDLVELTVELEDSYGIRIPDEEAAKILTVGQAADYVAAHAEDDEADSGESLADLLDQLPEDLARQAFTHASWVDHRAESYERLAFLGDVVLSLAVSTHLYPRFERYGAGRLTKVRAQAVSGASCAEVALELGVPERLGARRPEGTGRSFEMLAGSERVLASVCEAVIGAAYLAFGIERVAPAVVASFEAQIDDALENPVDYKSLLQERLARRAEVVTYRIDSEEGPGARAQLRGGRRGRRRRARPRRGPDQEGRRAEGGHAGARGGGRLMHLRSISMKGFKSFPDRTKLDFSPGVAVVVGPNGSGKSNITDAVLWALGEQSPLAVRGQTMKDVIFAGGHGVKGSSAAEVEVVIDNARRAARQRVLRDLDRAPARPLGRGRVPAQRRPLPAGRRGRGPVRHRARQGDALGGLPGPGRVDRALAAARPAAADRGGRGPRQAPQAPPPRPAQARAHRGEPLPRARRGARGPLAPAPAQAPGRGR